MKSLLIAGALALGLSACSSLTAEEETAIRDAAVEVAIEVIAEAKAAGIDPVQMSESKLRIIRVGCGAADKFLPILEAYIEAKNAEDPDFEPLDLRGYAAAACAIADAVITPKEEAA